MLAPVTDPATVVGTSLLQEYLDIADSMDRVLRLGEIAARHGDGPTAATDLLAALDELEPQLAALRDRLSSQH